MSDFDALSDEMRQFVTERNWDQFHDPKSLLLAMTAEVGELCELFQWLPADQARAAAKAEPRVGAVADEMADVLLYLIALANTLDVDLMAAARSKLERNRSRFPVRAVSGTAPTRPHHSGQDL